MEENLNKLPEDIQRQVKELLKECSECSVISELGGYYVIEGRPLIISPLAEYTTFNKENINN